MVTDISGDSAIDTPILKGQRILVTGATGQVARPIAEAFNWHNEVWAAARFTNAEAKRELENQGINTVSYTQGEENLEHLPDVDYVVHCAVNLAPETTDDAFRQNVEGTGFLMSRYRQAKAFFHMSSTSIYRQPEDSQAVLSEDALLGGFSSYAPHYAMSKLAAEGVVRFQARQLQLPTVIARLDVAYGLHGHGGAPSILYQFLQAGIPYVQSRFGESYCCPIYEDDIVRMVERLLTKAAVPAVVVNFGGDEAVSVEEIIRYLESLTGLSMKIEVKDLASWQTQIPDSTLRRQLAGVCQVDWRTGLRKVLETRFPGSIIAP